MKRGRRFKYSRQKPPRLDFPPKSNRGRWTSKRGKPERRSSRGEKKPLFRPRICFGGFSDKFFLPVIFWCFGGILFKIIIFVKIFAIFFARIFFGQFFQLFGENSSKASFLLTIFSPQHSAKRTVPNTHRPTTKTLWASFLVYLCALCLPLYLLLPCGYPYSGSRKGESQWKVKTTKRISQLRLSFSCSLIFPSELPGRDEVAKCDCFSGGLHSLPPHLPRRGGRGRWRRREAESASRSSVIIHFHHNVAHHD